MIKIYVVSTYKSNFNFPLKPPPKVKETNGSTYSDDLQARELHPRLLVESGVFVLKRSFRWATKT